MMIGLNLKEFVFFSISMMASNWSSLDSMEN